MSGLSVDLPLDLPVHEKADESCKAGSVVGRARHLLRSRCYSFLVAREGEADGAAH